MRSLSALLFLATTAAASGAAGSVNFSREVLPILSENCFACHGPDESHRKADLRLDTFEGATKMMDGVAAIVPGKPEASELVARIVSTDPDELMPTPESHKPRLQAEQVEVLKRWIAEGAGWGKHWAYENRCAVKCRGRGMERKLWKHRRIFRCARRLTALSWRGCKRNS